MRSFRNCSSVRFSQTRPKFVPHISRAKAECLRPARVFLEAFFDGFGLGAPFFPAKLPGAPTKIFADEGEPWPGDVDQEPKTSKG